MICPICSKEIEQGFLIAFEKPYLNIKICREHVQPDYNTFVKDNAQKLLEMYQNGQIKQINKIKRV